MLLRLVKIALLASLLTILGFQLGRSQPQGVGPFAPFVIDEAKFNAIDAAVGHLSMPRDAHIAWQQMWMQLERDAQAQAEAARKAQEGKK